MLRLRMDVFPANEVPLNAQMWKIVLAYDGTDFHGWQVQPGLRTVQGELASAIEHVTGERVLPQGSGRTDAGVHALAQVASVALTSPIPPPNLLRALNRALPPSIRATEADARATRLSCAPFRPQQAIRVPHLSRGDLPAAVRAICVRPGMAARRSSDAARRPARGRDARFLLIRCC